MSSLKDLASLIMIPSLVKDGRLDTVKPLGNSIIHPDATGNNDGTDGSTPAEGNFTFTRGSNLSATRVDASQLIEKGRENVLLYSQDFSNTAWNKSNLSLTANQTDPLGGTNAFLFTSTSASNNLFVQSLSNQNKVCSIYAKAGNRSIFAIVNNTYGNGATFNLSAETAVSSGQGSLAVIEDVGNGWFRCSVYFSLGTQFLLVLSDVNGNGYSNGDTISFFGSQMELGTIATPYIETGATTAQAGILENTPRFDYSGGATCPSLLLEPSRTNTIESSEYLGHSSWILGRMTQLSNQTISPEGIQNATLIANTTETGNHNIQNTLGSYTNASLAVSFYAKKKDNDYLQFGIYNSSTKWAAQKINLATGAKLGSGNAGFHDAPSGVSVTDVGNDWWRVEALFTTTLTGANEVFYFAPTPTDTNPTGTFGLYGGWTGATTENAYIYGVQVESGVSYSTSYIPTYGVSQTRALDFCNKTGATDLIGQTEGTIFYDWIMNHESPNTSEDLYSLVLSDGTNNKLIGINNYNNLLVVFIKDTTTQFLNNSYTGGADGARIKVGLAYANNDVALYINGTQIATDSSATIPTLSQIKLNSYWNGNLVDSTSVNQLLLFKTRLTNAELAALTS